MVLPPNILAVIPCLNEGPEIAAVVSAAQHHLPVLVIDDGSTDDTATRARDAGAEVMSHPQTRGKGVALRTGFEEACRRGATWAVCLDGDGQHAVEDIPILWATAERTGADLVVGNRFAGPSSMPIVRRLTNQLMSRLLGRIAGRPLPDSQCGFRLVRLERWRELRLVTECFEIESEMLWAAVRAGWRVEFAPVKTIYRNEESRIRPLRDGCRWLRWYVRAVGSPRSHPGPARQPGRRARSFMSRIPILLTIAILVAVVPRWISHREASRIEPAGFSTGLLQGAAMPCALPLLAIGSNPIIYAERNTGRSYKLGYTLGVNACGALFFGLLYRRRPPAQAPATEAASVA